jgi:acetyl esterase/lipase
MAIDTMNVPARTIPLPLSVSPQARAALAGGATRQALPTPELNDIAGWRGYIDAMNGRMEPFAEMVCSSPKVKIEVERTGTCESYVVTRRNGADADTRKINFFLHGGGWVCFGGRTAVLPAAAMAHSFGGVVYAPDYRMPPDHYFPAALDDCLSAYKHVLDRFGPQSVLVMGESAGGNLAAALMLRARDEGLAPPCGLFLNTPVLDLTHSSDSLSTNWGVDVVLSGGVKGLADFYRNGADPSDPYLSPLLGDLSRGFPPTYIRTGTRDLLLSDSVRMHAALRKAGVEADLYVGEAMPHGGFIILGPETPEDVDARNDLARWLGRRWRAQD